MRVNAMIEQINQLPISIIEINLWKKIINI